MPLTGFEPAIPVSERPQTHTIDRTATGISLHLTNNVGHFLPPYQFIMNMDPHILIQSTAGNTGVFTQLYLKQVVGMVYFGSQTSVTA
jgi:hypothetical protein